MTTPPSVIEVMQDPQLLGGEFGGKSWWPWMVALAALLGLPLPSEAALALYRAQTGRTTWPTARALVAWFIVGRRAGKSRMGAFLAVFFACFLAPLVTLAAGEVGVVMLLAADRKQAGVVFGYVKGLLAHPLLRPLVVAERAESVELRGGVAIEVHTSSYRSVRGRTVLLAILDECAFWHSEDSANPDAEVVAALRPALATTGGLIVGLSTPYARRGVVYRAFEQHYGKDTSTTLVWRADSRTMNPELPAELIEDALVEDEAAARSEWLAEFRADLESFVDREAVERCVIPGRLELPRVSGIRYQAFTDPSGGRSDSFTLCVAHREGDRCVVDVLREVRPPFSPDEVTREYAELCSTYNISKVVGDKYGAAWVQERFRSHGLRYEPSPLAKSDLYTALLGPLNSGRVELLDDARLVAQLVGLERRTARGGRDSVDHAPGGRDDLANSLAGVTHLVLSRSARPTFVPFDPETVLLGGSSDPWEARWMRWERRQERRSGA